MPYYVRKEYRPRPTQSDYARIAAIALLTATLAVAIAAYVQSRSTRVLYEQRNAFNLVSVHDNCIVVYDNYDLCRRLPDSVRLVVINKDSINSVKRYKLE